MINLEQLPNTRAEAKALGSKYYYIGVPCPHGHNTARRTRDRRCLECRKNDKIKEKKSDAWKRKSLERAIIYMETPEGKRKIEAQKLARAAIRKGEIERLPCVICGATYKLHAHHEDYDKPLDVVWLCVKHHHERHKELSMGDASKEGALRQSSGAVLQPSPTLLEKVGKAICDYEWRGQAGMQWENLDASMREVYIGEAQAAIAAYEEVRQPEHEILVNTILATKNAEIATMLADLMQAKEAMIWSKRAIGLSPSDRGKGGVMDKAFESLDEALATLSKYTSVGGE